MDVELDIEKSGTNLGWASDTIGMPTFAIATLAAFVFGMGIFFATIHFSRVCRSFFAARIFFGTAPARKSCRWHQAEAKQNQCEQVNSFHLFQIIHLN